MVASYSGHYDCVKDLIMQGADINYQREVWRENSVRLKLQVTVKMEISFH